MSRAWLIALLLLGLPVAHVRASDSDRTFSLGVGGHFIAAIHDVCETHGDVSECTTFATFAGVDLDGLYWVSSGLGLGLRLAGSKDLAAEGRGSSDGESSDRDVVLWRVAAQAKLAPALFPSGLWLGAEAGVAVLYDSIDDFDTHGRPLDRFSATQPAPLVGLAGGWDFTLTEHFLLELELRGELLAFGDPKPLTTGITTRSFGTACWLGLGVRGVYED